MGVEGVERAVRDLHVFHRMLERRERLLVGRVSTRAIRPANRRDTLLARQLAPLHGRTRLASVLRQLLGNASRQPPAHQPPTSSRRAARRRRRTRCSRLRPCVHTRLQSAWRPSHAQPPQAVSASPFSSAATDGMPQCNTTRTEPPARPSPHAWPPRAPPRRETPDTSAARAAGRTTHRVSR